MGNDLSHGLKDEGSYGQAFNPQSLPYEADDSPLLMNGLIRSNEMGISRIRDHEDDYVKLARQSLERYIRQGTVIDIDIDLPKKMTEDRAGIFVTIKQYGQLRGCIGTIVPSRKSVAEEIIHNAISAGTRDPRFFPIEEEELGSLVYSVDVLSKPESIQSIHQLDVERYGVIISYDSRAGILLPKLDGINTPKEQVGIALQKAGIDEDESYTMERFEVIRHQ